MALPSDSMVLYLTGGWYTKMGQRRLRDEVVDGAIDTAGCLFRAGVSPHVVSHLALTIRALASHVDPLWSRARASNAPTGRFEDAERSMLRRRLQADTDRQPALQSFVTDCLEHVHDAMDLRGLYLHLVHVTRMMQVLQVARISGAASGLFGGAANPSFHMTTDVAAPWTPPIDPRQNTGADLKDRRAAARPQRAAKDAAAPAPPKPAKKPASAQRVKRPGSKPKP